MKITPFSPNHTIVTLSSGIELFISYKTCVGGFIPGKGYVRTDTKWSNTTSRHLNKYLGGEAVMIAQADLDAMYAAA